MVLPHTLQHQQTYYATTAWVMKSLILVCHLSGGQKQKRAGGACKQKQKQKLTHTHIDIHYTNTTPKKGTQCATTTTTTNNNNNYYYNKGTSRNTIVREHITTMSTTTAGIPPLPPPPPPRHLSLTLPISATGSPQRQSYYNIMIGACQPTYPWR